MRAYKPWLTWDPLFHASKYGAMQKKALSILHTHTRNTIQRRRREILSRKENDGGEEEDLDCNSKFLIYNFVLCFGQDLK